MVQFLLSVLSLCWFAVSFHNRNPFSDVYFQDQRSKVLGRIRSCSSLQKFERVTYCTRGVFFYLKPFMNILTFGSPLSRRNVGFQRRDIGFVPIWNVVTLDLNVATLVLITLWNVMTLDLNVGMLAIFLSGTSRRCIRMLRR